MTYTRVRHHLTGEPLADMICRDVDGAFIPADPANIDWQAYTAWLKAGHTPAEPHPMPEVPRPKAEALSLPPQTPPIF